MTIHDRHKEWIEARGISADLAEKLGLRTVEREGKAWLSVPYVENGVELNHKYRRTSEKDHRMDSGAPLTLWNHDCLLEESSRPVVITEGEWDAMVALQLGWRAVSVPNGGGSGNVDPAKLEYLWRSRDLLNRVERFIIATDDDAVGRSLRAAIVSLLGAEKCSFVEFQFPCKDLNEVLLEYGQDAVSRCLTSAKPFPVQGLYSLSDFPEMPPVSGIPIGIACMADKIEIVPSTLTIFTGYSNMGKTSVMNTIVANAIANDMAVCIASFETAPKPTLRNQIAQALIGCSEYEFGNHPQKQAAFDALEKQLKIISNALEDDLEFDIDAFLELAKVSVQRDGVRLIVLDPWNELEHRRRRDETLTEYIGRAIRAVKRFARQHQVAVWIVAHPTKPMKGDNRMPSLYDVSDSANWANKADYGMVYHRKDKSQNCAELAVVKVRMGLPGKCDVETVKLDHRTGRIAAYIDGEAPA